MEQGVATAARIGTALESRPRGPIGGKCQPFGSDCAAWAVRLAWMVPRFRPRPRVRREMGKPPPAGLANEICLAFLLPAWRKAGGTIGQPPDPWLLAAPGRRGGESGAVAVQLGGGRQALPWLESPQCLEALVSASLAALHPPTGGRRGTRAPWRDSGVICPQSRALRCPVRQPDAIGPGRPTSRQRAEVMGSPVGGWPCCGHFLYRKVPNCPVAAWQPDCLRDGEASPQGWPVWCSGRVSEL